MKSIYVLLLLMVIPMLPKAQTTDSIVNHFLRAAPKGWVGKIEKDRLIIQKTDTIYRVFNNKINSNVELPAKDTENTFDYKKYGKPTLAVVEYKLEKKWSQKKILATQKQNADVYKKIQALPKKCKIAHLKNNHLSAKGTAVFVPVTKQDELNIELYEKEKSRLEKMLIVLPTYQSQLYALFRIQETGCDTAMDDFYPKTTSTECYQLHENANSIFLSVK